MQSNWIMKVADFLVVSIIFVDDKLIIDEFTRGHVIGIKWSGRCQTNVAEAVGISQFTVSRLWQYYISTRKSSISFVEGCLHITTPSDDKFASLKSRNNRTIQSRSITAELYPASGPLVSENTVYR